MKKNPPRQRSKSHRYAMGISVHTGWGACVVVGGSPRAPVIIANEVIHVLGDAERFCYHAAAEMEPREAQKWIARLRKRALANAKRRLAPLVAQAGRLAIVAKECDPGSLEEILASHPRIHTAEGCFYRDVFRDACTKPVHLISPSSLDVANIGKVAPPPWGRDQKLAALAALGLITR